MGIAEAVPQLAQCCCGCQLRMGTKIIGWLGVALGTLGFIVFLLLAFGAIPVKNEGDTPRKPEELHVAKVHSTSMAIMYLLFAFFSTFLLIGAYKGKESYYLPWMMFIIMNLTHDIMSLIVMITLSVRFTSIAVIIIDMYRSGLYVMQMALRSSIGGSQVSSLLDLLVLRIGIFLCIFQSIDCYFFLIVHSDYRQQQMYAKRRYKIDIT